MSPFESQIADLVRRYDKEAADLKRSLKNMSTTERLMAQTHANVKEGAASEIRCLMLACGVKTGARA